MDETGKARRTFRAVNILYVILSWWIHVIPDVSKTTECTTHRVYPNVDRGFWVMMMHQ